MKRRYRTSPDNQKHKTGPALRPLIAFILFWVFFSGCGCLSGRFSGPPESGPDTETARLMAQLREQNSELTTFKGIGRMKWRHQGAVQNARIAWVGEVPDKVRLEILDLTSRPALSLSFDGDQLYFFSHPDGQYEKMNSADADLMELISIPVPIRDIIQLLSGRIPVPADDFDKMVAVNWKNKPALTVDSGWLGGRRKILLDPTGRTVAACEVFNSFGSLVYRVDFEGRHPIDEFTIPERIMLSGANGAVLRLQIERYWANISVPPKAFTLEPPE